MSTPGDVTRLLTELSAGRQEVLPALIPLVYDELRRLAESYLRRERGDHTLQATALVHEAYLRLVDQNRVKWQNRAHFFGIAAQAMRRVLVDHARAHRASKRGGSYTHVTLHEAAEVAAEQTLDLIALDTALERLSAVDPQQSKIAELRYFGGLTIEETAEVLGVSPATIKREWTIAKAWLRREIGQGA
jgi:RNA polymerase sigma factor (TIGR02999 family)